MSVVQMLLLTETRKVASSVSSAKAKISRATTLRDVVAAMRIPVRAEFRSMRHLFPDLRQLPAFAENRAEAIVREQLNNLAELPDAAAVQSQRGRLMAGEWQLLNGNFPRLARLVTVESQKALHKKREEHVSPEN